MKEEASGVRWGEQKNVHLLVLASHSREAQRTPATGVNAEVRSWLHWRGMLWKMVTFTAGLPWLKGDAKLRRMQN